MGGRNTKKLETRDIRRALPQALLYARGLASFRRFHLLEPKASERRVPFRANRSYPNVPHLSARSWIHVTGWSPVGKLLCMHDRDTCVTV